MKKRLLEEHHNTKLLLAAMTIKLLGFIISLLRTNARVEMNTTEISCSCTYRANKDSRVSAAYFLQAATDNLLLPAQGLESAHLTLLNL